MRFNCRPPGIPDLDFSAGPIKSVHANSDKKNSKRFEPPIRLLRGERKFGQFLAGFEQTRSLNVGSLRPAYPS